MNNDSRLQGSVLDEIKWWRNVDLDARRIHVTTKDGTVTLTGSVSSWYERE